MAFREATKSSETVWPTRWGLDNSVAVRSQNCFAAAAVVGFVGFVVAAASCAAGFQAAVVVFAAFVSAAVPVPCSHKMPGRFVLNNENRPQTPGMKCR